MMDDISIDRLVFEVPGLTQNEAKELARRVGEELAAKSTGVGNFGVLTVVLDQKAETHDFARLANEIVSSLLRQIG